jgi:hypothetical protein
MCQKSTRKAAISPSTNIPQLSFSLVSQEKKQVLKKNSPPLQPSYCKTHTIICPKNPSHHPKNGFKSW